MAAPGRSCVIIVENLPVPFDRRVWQEAQALARAGWRVSVICPASPAYPASYEMLDGIAIYRHPLPEEGRGALAYFREYATALWHETRLLWKVRREQGFAVIQACNPPDLIFLAAAPFKALGARFVFDQHDVSPELFVVKFGRKGFLHSALLFFERCSYAMADRVVTANATFRDFAIGRGRKDPSRVVTGYIGIINEQDGVDHFVEAVGHLVNKRGFRDFVAVVVGSGPALDGVKALAQRLGLDDFIVFTGYLSGDALLSHISAFDIGVIPDPFNEANDVMSMNKVFEYCALGVPTACYPLRETKRLLGDAGVYAPTLDPAGLAEACLTLMQDEGLRKRCAAEAARLSKEAFVWEREAEKYVAVYESLVGTPAGRAS